jgi:ribonuclease P protein component
MGQYLGVENAIAADIQPDRPGRLTFTRRQRISRADDFAAAYAANARQARGPLVVFTRPNGLPVARLGLSVPRRVGGAVQRNAIKRRLREAFRLLQHECPAGYDLVIAVRPHEIAPMERYRECLESAWRTLDREWAKRARKAQEREGE